MRSRFETIAGPDAIRPCVIKCGVTGSTTLLEPGTTESAAADFAGFLEGTACPAKAIDRL